jgi:hypothetical protein
MLEEDQNGGEGQKQPKNKAKIQLSTKKTLKS